MHFRERMHACRTRMGSMTPPYPCRLNRYKKEHMCWRGVRGESSTQGRQGE